MKLPHTIYGFSYAQFLTFIFSLLTFVCFAQHPSTLKYNLKKKTYTITGQELRAIKSHAKEWLKQHDTIVVKGGLSNIRFTPDDMMLEECDSAAQKIAFYDEKFKGFPATDDGTFYGADIQVRNKQGQYERCIINLSYFYEVVKIWYPGGQVLYKKSK